MASPPARIDLRTRWPEELHAAVAESAAANDRSLNGEILHLCRVALGLEPNGGGLREPGVHGQPAEPIGAGAAEHQAPGSPSPPPASPRAARTTVARVSACPRERTHRTGVFCKACGQTP